MGISKKSWNERTGFHKAITLIGGTVWGTNLTIAICGILYFMVKFYSSRTLPSWISGYNFGIKSALNALLLLVLNNGHDRYYSLYSEYTDLTFCGNVIDLTLKILLQVATVMQLVWDDSIVAFCMVAYLLTLFRNIELKHNDLDNVSIKEQICTKWIPYNIRHNIVMAMNCALFYLFKYKVLIFCAAWLGDISIKKDLFSNPDVENLCECCVFLLILAFDLYWIYRVIRKIDINPSNVMKKEYAEKLAEGEPKE